MAGEVSFCRIAFFCPVRFRCARFCGRSGYLCQNEGQACSSAFCAVDAYSPCRSRNADSIRKALGQSARARVCIRIPPCHSALAPGSVSPCHVKHCTCPPVGGSLAVCGAVPCTPYPRKPPPPRRTLGSHCPLVALSWRVLCVSVSPCAACH